MALRQFVAVVTSPAHQALPVAVVLAPVRLAVAGLVGERLAQEGARQAPHLAVTVEVVLAVALRLASGHKA